jgi:predicted enzyme related to lactoylglutathione lyase
VRFHLSLRDLTAIDPAMIFKEVFMEFKGICLITKNVPALAEFYKRILCVDIRGDDKHAELGTEGAGIAIFSEQGMEAMAPASMQEAGSGKVTLMFQVADVDGKYARICALGAPIVKPPQTHPWGARSFWFRDPDGNIVDFYSPDEK